MYPEFAKKGYLLAKNYLTTNDGGFCKLSYLSKINSTLGINGIKSFADYLSKTIYFHFNFNDLTTKQSYSASYKTICSRGEKNLNRKYKIHFFGTEK